MRKVSFLEMLQNRMRMLSRKRINLREELLNQTRSATQKWMNTAIPPSWGRALGKNTVAEAGPDSVILTNKNGRLIFKPYHSGIFQVYIQSKYWKEPWLDKHSWTIEPNQSSPDGWRFQKKAGALEYYHLLAGDFEATLRIEPETGTVSCLLGTDLVMAAPFSPRITRDWLLIEKHLLRPGEVKVFGLGENTPPMDKAGKKVVMWNTAPLIYKMGANPLYQSWPVVIYQYSHGPALGLVFDNAGYASFQFSGDGKRLKYAVRDGELSYFVLLGPTLPELMRQLASLTGTLAPLPKWTLGYQQSRWTYSPSSRVREIAAAFRDRDIPCDTIHLDIDYMDHYKSFTWGEDFKDYQNLIRDMHGQGFKIVPILDPGLKVEKGYPPYDTGAGRGKFVRRESHQKMGMAGPKRLPGFYQPFRTGMVGRTHR